jgi:hypothetical protein
MATWIATIATAAAVVATAIAWWSSRESARSAASSRACRPRRRAVRQGRRRTAAPSTHTTGSSCGSAPSAGGWRPAELILLGLDRLEGIDFETGARNGEFRAEGELRIDGWSSPAMDLGGLDVGDLHSLEVPLKAKTSAS